MVLAVDRDATLPLKASTPAQIKNLKDENIFRPGPSNQEHKETGQIKQDLVWRNIIIMAILHTFTLQGWWYVFTGRVMWQTILFHAVFVQLTTTGITAGAHRLWSHKTYKAKLPFRIWLMIWQSAALQNDIYTWVRDHRAHHKFTDTDADPHNSSRGFFFSHMGWLLMRKHPEVMIKGKTIDMSDVEADPVVVWQRKYYTPLVLMLTFILPTYLPIFLWNESRYVSFIMAVCKYVSSLHGTWSVNSAAHMWGYKPYDISINPTENKFVATISLGEGWHNYHHTFPWDYKAAEFAKYNVNGTAALIDFAAYIGQAYDLKTVSEELIAKRILRTGDTTWKGDSGVTNLKGFDGRKNHDFHEDCVWGWDDKDMTDEEKKMAKIMYSKTI